MRPRRVQIALACLACLAACKGDDGLDSGLPASKPAAELAPAEQTQFCEAARDYYEARLGEAQILRFECTIEGISTSLIGDQSVATCNAARDACINEPQPDPDPDPMTEPDTCELGIDWATCTATVDELEACFSEYTDQGADALGAFSCDRMAEYVKEIPTYDPSVLDPGPACEAAAAKCPSLDLGTGDDAMTG